MQSYSTLQRAKKQGEMPLPRPSLHFSEKKFFVCKLFRVHEMWEVTEMLQSNVNQLLVCRETHCCTEVVVCLHGNGS